MWQKLSLVHITVFILYFNKKVKEKITKDPFHPCHCALQIKQKNEYKHKQSMYSNNLVQATYLTKSLCLHDSVFVI